MRIGETGRKRRAAAQRRYGLAEPTENQYEESKSFLVGFIIEPTHRETTAVGKIVGYSQVPRRGATAHPGGTGAGRHRAVGRCAQEASLWSWWEGTEAGRADRGPAGENDLSCLWGVGVACVRGGVPVGELFSVSRSGLTPGGGGPPSSSPKPQMPSEHRETGIKGSAWGALPKTAAAGRLRHLRALRGRTLRRNGGRGGEGRRKAGRGHEEVRLQDPSSLLSGGEL